MNVVRMDQTDMGYRRAEYKAAQYFASLVEQMTGKQYVSALTEDFLLWKKDHVHRRSLLSFLTKGTKNPSTKDTKMYIDWLKYTGKLDSYLDRSVSYIYMRDLGKSLDNPVTQTRIKYVVNSVKKHLLKSVDTQKGTELEYMSLAWLYRKAQKKGIESAVIWVMNKLKAVANHIPKELNAEHAQRKLIKIIIGVFMHAYEELPPNLTSEERAKRLDEAIRLGYSYGLTYPFIDDLLDAQILSAQEKVRYSSLIRQSLATGTVPELGKWAAPIQGLMQYVHGELREAFEYIKNYQNMLTQITFFEQSNIFFESQEIDRVKHMDFANYSNEELYIPIILKSSSSRLIVRSVIAASSDDEIDDRTFYNGIYNQLADDFADMFDDMREGAVTPYTYYLKYHKQRPDLINPYEMYWTVIYHLIHHVHGSCAKTREVVLDRAINGLKRCKERVGKDKYNEIMAIFASGNPTFNLLVQQMVQQASDVDFFDKLLRDQFILNLKNDRNEQEEFVRTIESVREQINNNLSIDKPADMIPMKEPLINAANYSLEGDGKRIRPILSWVMGVDQYGLEPKALMPLLRSLEYMHTASLIIDDLPSQDNASTRRGRATLHMVHNEATAELTGIFLILKAVREQASMKQYDPKTVLALMHYSAEKTEEMCMGQAMDLHSKSKPLTLDELNTICFYKTGIAFEACLVMPAILAQVNDFEIEALKKYAYHAGIAFQIKDDLLDLEGDHNLLGKPIGQDTTNSTSTFVSILGADGARKAMWEHYCLAMEALQVIPRKIAFLRHLLNYLINRDR
ncbi:polyprenyl synthetase family protein [Paenibacillus sp. N1-5-1-14]|uniref:polyprenyl synthetase family protein n=1 Tax=Paenibacillus radicibacter TaxID=2972488 RepID=UPI0021595F33|nr:polyprenyl synthetase family protein [Paenibacillus radicibacter]MCR8644278.1 polyprenyl synthetase family protein [Paenibacillus radicibacter]